ncbi:uncharacterized protein LOC132183395 [Corylus avellana]|uniref:uncharacterized protein LOC132183395 n=1 Tax=Corylus avellana TaxID=13451 RepID=UPI00286B934F|nr:uncharacterized protein LOC132183395 [Corylus avellana]
MKSQRSEGKKAFNFNGPIPHSPPSSSRNTQYCRSNCTHPQMAETYGMEKPNGGGGVFVDVTEGDETERLNGDSRDRGIHRGRKEEEEESLCGVCRRLISEIFFPDGEQRGRLLHRIKTSVAKNAPLLREASGNTGRKVLFWTRRGSPLRALLVISVGTIAFLALTGLLVFMLFFVAATFNAIVISLLVSLAAAGGFLALFFTCVTFIYIGALSVAAFVISSATISAIIAALIATGWIAFFWTLWLATKKSLEFAKHSLTVTGSALSAYSSGRHVRHIRVVEKVSD